MFNWFRRRSPPPQQRRQPSQPPTPPPPANILKKPWRKYKMLENGWNEKMKETLLENLHSKLGDDDYNIAFVGPLGGGKSSVINSFMSIFKGTMSCRSHAGTLGTSFTTYFHQIHGSGYYKKIIFYDSKGIEEMDKGIPQDDIIKIAQGNIPPGYKFADTTMKDSTPDKKLRIHSFVYVLNAENVNDGLKEEFRKKIIDVMFKMKHINPAPNRMLLLTHIDCLDDDVDNDITNIFKSKTVKEVVEKASGITGIPINAIFPVKCYDSEMELEPLKDVPLLLALCQMVSYAEDTIETFKEDNFASTQDQ